MTFTILTVAFTHGLISSLSACVYPLIPITTAIFGAGKAGKWGEGLLLSGIYVAGMAITYMALGVSAALTGTLFGSYMGNPIVVITFALLFFYLGLSFIDLLPLPLPNLGDKLQAKKSKSLIYPFVMGIFSGFIAAPCTAPLFGALLIEIATNASQHQSILPGVVQSLFFSLGMGAPFLAIGAFAIKLPKPGSWMRFVKFIGAAVLFAAGYHYIEDLYGPFPDQHNLITYSISGVLLFLIFLILADPGTSDEMGMRKKILTANFLLISGFGLFLATSPMASSTQESQISTNQTGNIIWYDSLNKGMEVASKNGSILMIDFWAEWCSSCHEMEEHLFRTKEFSRLIQTHNVTLVRLDYTVTDTQEKEDLAARYEIRGLPTLVFTDHKGKLITALLGFKNKQDSLNKINYILTDYPLK